MDLRKGAVRVEVLPPEVVDRLQAADVLRGEHLLGHEEDARDESVVDLGAWFGGEGRRPSRRDARRGFVEEEVDRCDEGGGVGETALQGRGEWGLVFLGGFGLRAVRDDVLGVSSRGHFIFLCPVLSWY